MMALDNTRFRRDDPAAMLLQLMPANPVTALALSAGAFYAAARMGGAALDPDSRNPAAAAIAHWLPIASVALAALKSQPQAAVSVIFATSVACLTLVPGVALVSAPRVHPANSDPTFIQRRAWPMLLPAALLALIAGFRGAFTPLHAILFVVQGLAALLLWTGGDMESADDFTQSHSVSLRFLLAIAWFVLSSIGAILAVHAIGELSARMPTLTGGVLAALILSPALILPMIGSSLAMEAPDSLISNDAGTFDHGKVFSLCVGCAMLNLCVLLPMAIVIRPYFVGTPWSFSNEALVYSISIWRIDTVLLIIIGAALLPISVGRWIPRRTEGVALIASYAIYMFATAALARR